jgi:hypothetical protein
MTVSRIVAAAFFGWISVQPAQVTFTTVDRGSQSEIEEPRQAIVRTPAEWAALWKAHGGKGKPPEVDLARSIVIGVFLGTRPTAAHTVEIIRIEKRDTDLVVTYREQSPAAGDMVAQMLTSPFHIVRTASHPGRIRFDRAR